MILTSWLVLIFFTSVYSQNCSDYYTCQLELYDQLLNKSRPSIRPINEDAKNLPVNFGFSLIRIVSVNEDDSSLTIRAHLNQTWKASIFSWNSTLYFNVQHYRIPAHSIWTPKIELINPSTTIDSEANHFINVQSTGLFELSYSSLLTVPCNFDLYNFPFDQQKCTFKIGSALYDVNEVAINQAIDIVIDEPSLMPSGYSFVSHSIKTESVFFAGFDRTYHQISIELNIRRHSTYFIRLISWPGSILILLTLTIFCLPPTAFERIIYGGFLLLGQLILLAIFAFYIPKRLGTVWPSMGQTIFYDIYLTAMALVFSVFVRMLSDGKHYTIERPPMKIRSFIYGHLTKLIGYKPLSYKTLVAHHENNYDTMDVTENETVIEPLTSISNGSPTSDPLILSSNIMSHDVGSIKQKFQVLLNEHAIHQEWILLAHIINRLCFIVYLFFFSFSVGYHLFS